MQTIIEFGDLTFYGYKLKFSQKYSDKFFNDLLVEINDYNRVKYYDALVDQYNDLIHVKISWSLILKDVSIASLFIGLISLYYFTVPGLIICGISMFAKILSDVFTKHVNTLFEGKSMCKEVTNLAFNSEYR